MPSCYRGGHLGLATSQSIPQGTSAAATANAIDSAANDLVSHRQKSVLILYYPARARMTEDDLADVHEAFRDAAVTVEQKEPGLDVLVDTRGGDPTAAYRLAQLIRDFAEEVSFLVADHAYSAGTLLCFAGNEIRLGHGAGLSPIDITLVSRSDNRPVEEVELASIDSYMEFTKRAREEMEKLFQRLGCSGARTRVESDLLVKMVDQVGALQIGGFFRARRLTGQYAQELLDSYMFAGMLDKISRRTEVINNFLFRAPIHDFHLDYHLCNTWMLPVEEMQTLESDLSKKTIDTLENEANGGTICPHLSKLQRLPFIRLYRHTPTPQPATGGTP
jgi:hypothetical protein